jgi:hypothetical protein
MRSFLVLLLLLACPALAVSRGGKLYVKSKDVKLRKDPNLKAAAVMTLQPGEEVVWNGASAKDKTWHEVTVAGKKGFVHQSELTPQPLVPELSSEGKPMSAQAFAASGYVKCSFGPPTGKYSGSPREQEAQAELIYLEEMNRERASSAVLDEKTRALQR